MVCESSLTPTVWCGNTQTTDTQCWCNKEILVLQISGDVLITSWSSQLLDHTFCWFLFGFWLFFSPVEIIEIKKSLLVYLQTKSQCKILKIEFSCDQQMHKKWLYFIHRQILSLTNIVLMAVKEDALSCYLKQSHCYVSDLLIFSHISSLTTVFLPFLCDKTIKNPLGEKKSIAAFSSFHWILLAKYCHHFM